MFIRQCTRTRNGKRQAYWALVESYRTERGPRQRVVAWLGKQDEVVREGTLLAAAEATEPDMSPKVVPSHVQKFLFDEEDEASVPAPRWVEINTAGVRVENCRQFGGPWLALELIRRLKLDEFLSRAMTDGQAQVPWSLSSMILVIARLLEPASELYTAEQWYPKTALPELLGVPVKRVDDNRLYRTLDELLPQKEQLQVHLKQRLGELFALEYARVEWKKIEAVRDWATTSAGCYLLRTNVLDWTDEELWKTYMQLTEAEAAFRIQKSDLSLRPVWHQKDERVSAHILVCFLGYVLWKTLGQLCQRAGLGNEPRRVLDELAEIRLIDVILPTRGGPTIRKRCVSRPSEHQQILLDRLGLRLPSGLRLGGADK